MHLELVDWIASHCLSRRRANPRHLACYSTDSMTISQLDFPKPLVAKPTCTTFLRWSQVALWIARCWCRIECIYIYILEFLWNLDLPHLETWPRRKHINVLMCQPIFFLWTFSQLCRNMTIEIPLAGWNWSLHWGSSCPPQCRPSQEL